MNNKSKSQKSPQLLPRKVLASVVIMSLSCMPNTGCADILDLKSLPPAVFATATALSPDGKIVVGTAGDKVFIWSQASGMRPISASPLGPGQVVINDVSNDGGTMAGYRLDSFQFTAVVWTREGGLQTISTAPGVTMAHAVSANGQVVVGKSGGHAFSWTRSGGLVTLPGIAGVPIETARGVSADGSVIVGHSFNHGIRWVNGAIADDLGSGTDAAFVSQDGHALAGYLSKGSDVTAFRWTKSEGVQEIVNTIDGTNIYPTDMSGDGKVIIGVLHQATPSKLNVRWSQAKGLQTIEQWLTDNGVAGGSDLDVVNKTNDDGTVVVGALKNGHAFIARVGNYDEGSGIIEPQNFNASLQGAAYAQGQDMGTANLVLRGLHSGVLRGLPAAGHGNVWVSGDLGQQNNPRGNDPVGVMEVGGAYGFSDSLVGKLAVGHSASRQDLDYSGRIKLRGNYVVPELIANLPGTPLTLSTSAYFSNSEADIRRGYDNAGARVYSTGNPDVRTRGLRVRLDWRDAIVQGGFHLTPYFSLTRYRSHIDSYRETGGGFPAQWDARTEKSTFSQLGADASYALNDNWTLLGRLEVGHRSEGKGVGASGQVIGLYRFNFDGMDYQRNWVRAGIGVEGKVGPGVLSLILNSSSEKNGPRNWLYAGYRVDF